MTEEQGNILVGEVRELQETVAQSVYTSSHLSDQLGLMHQTIVIQTDYLIWTFAVVAFGCSLVAFIAGFLLAKGR